MLIVGAGGQGKEALAVLLDNGHDQPIHFFDEAPDASTLLYGKFKVYSTQEEVKQYFVDHSPEFIVAVGHPRIRKKLTETLKSLGGHLSSVISKSAHLFQFNDSFDGMIAKPGAVISHGVEIGSGCIIHVHASVGHSCIIGDYSNIGPGAALIGPVHIGNNCQIGARAIILPGLNIGNNVIIGAGVVVREDLANNESYIGINLKEDIV